MSYLLYEWKHGHSFLFNNTKTGLLYTQIMKIQTPCNAFQECIITHATIGSCIFQDIISVNQNTPIMMNILKHSMNLQHFKHVLFIISYYKQIHFPQSFLNFSVFGIVHIIRFKRIRNSFLISSEVYYTYVIIRKKYVIFWKNHIFYYCISVWLIVATTIYNIIIRRDFWKLFIFKFVWSDQ